MEKNQFYFYLCIFLIYDPKTYKFSIYLDQNNTDLKMKTSKVSATFLAKFSSFLSKFKQTSTINVAHQQIRKLFSQYRFSQIAIPFATKMDTCDQLSDKQKKQYIKIYITLIDVYGQDVVLENYDRIIDSIAKKTFGVSDVIGHLCRSLLKRIYPTENIANYIKHLFMIFNKHIQIGKILKQIIESFDPEIISPFQSQIITMISQKMSLNQKNVGRIELLQAVLSLVLALQSKFYQEDSVHGIIIKNFKNQDWNVRKLCVQITYALFFIHNQVNKSLHQNVMELKYDKIKHVRDSVTNYTNLYKQIYGQEKEKQKQRPSIPSKTITHRKNIVNTDEKRLLMSKSPAMISRNNINQSQSKSNPKSLQKSIKNTVRNQEFFQNAGTRDVIKLPQNKSSVQAQEKIINKKIGIQRSFDNKIFQRDRFELQEQVQNLQNQQPNQVNFEQYLKNRPKHDNYFNFSPSQPNQKPYIRSQQKIQGINLSQKNKEFGSPKNVIKRQIVKNQQIKHKKQEKNLYQSNLTQSKDQPAEAQNTNVNLLRKQLQLIQLKFQKFKLQVSSKLNNIEKRVQNLQQKRTSNQSIDEISLSSLQKQIKQIKNQTNQNNYLQQSFQQKFNNSNVNQNNSKFMKKQLAYQTQENKKQFHSANFQTFSLPIQSNLNQKIKDSIAHDNWDQAFSLAIANNSRDSIIQLLAYNKIPQDKTVRDCLIVELRRNLSNFTVIKWLTNFVQQSQMPEQKKKKLISEVQKAQFKPEGTTNYESESRNYKMLKSILLKQLKTQTQLNKNFNDSIISS